MVRHHQQRLFWNQNFFLIAQFQMHAEVKYLCPVTWNIFLGKSNVKSRVYENTFKIFLTRHQINLLDWLSHCIRWIFLHKNHQMNVWTKTGSHHSIQSVYFSRGATRLLSSTFYNWIFGTQDNKKQNSSVWMILEWNMLPNIIQIIFLIPKKRTI